MAISRLFSFKRIFSNYLKDFAEKKVEIIKTKHDYFLLPRTFNKYGEKIIKYQINKFFNFIKDKIEDFNNISKNKLKKQLKDLLFDASPEHEIFLWANIGLCTVRLKPLLKEK